MKRQCQFFVTAIAALLAVGGSRAIASDIVLQKPILLEILARGQVTSPADKISITVLVVTDQKTGKQQTPEKLRSILSEIGIGPDAIKPSRQPYGFVGSEVGDSSPEPDNPFTQMARMAVYRIVITEPSKYDNVHSKLGNAGFNLVGAPISSLNDDRTALATARQQAFIRAESDAQELTAKLNLQFQRITKIDYVCSTPGDSIENLLLTASTSESPVAVPDLQTVVTRASVCLEFEATKK